MLGQSVIDLYSDTALVETHVLAYHRVSAESEHRDTVIGGRYLDWMDKLWQRVADFATHHGLRLDAGSRRIHRLDNRTHGYAVRHHPLRGTRSGDYSEEFFGDRSELRDAGHHRMISLTGKVAVVTGASRGIGKGIAVALGDCGATVYVTGRTAAAGEHELPGTVGETAAEVTRRGGTGIAVQVDHADDDQVDRSVRPGKSRAGPARHPGQQRVRAARGPHRRRNRSGRSRCPTGRWSTSACVPTSSPPGTPPRSWCPRGSGLIVATSGYVGVTYTYGVVFGMCKTAVDRMARDMAIELQPHNVASVSLWQGLTMTERAQRNLSARPEMTKSIVTRPAVGCSPEFPGRVIAALATDPDLMNLSGGTFITAELAQRYGITDIDGKTIPSLRAERGSPIWQPITGAGHGR